MQTGSPHDRASRFTPQVRGRIAGVLYLLCIVSGFFAELFVRAKLVVFSDAATTAHNIMTSPGLYRMGFVADLTALTSGIVIAVIFYDLFRPLSRNLALMSFTLAVVSNTVSLVASMMLFAPLMLFDGATAWNIVPKADLQVLGLLSIKLYELAYAVNLALFGLECFVTGYLIYRSTFLPKALGIMLAIAGACYLTNSVVNFMPAGFADFLFPYVLLPCLVAETALALWLVAPGVSDRNWHAIAGGRPGASSGT